MRIRFKKRTGIGVAVIFFLAIPAPANAFQFSGGVSVGGLQVGTVPRLAISPFAGFLWRIHQSVTLDLHHMFSLIPGARFGVYDRTALTLGHAWKSVNLQLGPSLSIYSMPVCGVTFCDRVIGIAPGAHAQVEWFFADPFGISASSNIDRASGSSRILSDTLVVMLTAGPIFRLPKESK